MKDFRQTLQSSSSHHGQKGHVSNMSMLGESGICGHMLDLAVPFAALNR